MLPDRWRNRIVCGDAVRVLRKLPNDSVDMALTSPPYWRQRNFGHQTETVWGDATCRHRWVTDLPDGVVDIAGLKTLGLDGGRFCTHCGAWKGQLGLEPDPTMYLRHILQVTEQIRRVLKPWGLFFLNLADTYCPRGVGGWLQPKQLLFLPARIAVAMQERGWLLRNVIIWHKPNAMPSSVRDRFTCTWEYLFMFAKSRRYFFALDDVRIPHRTGPGRFNYRVRQALRNRADVIGAIASAREAMIYRRNGIRRRKTVSEKAFVGNKRLAPEPGEPNAFHPRGKNPGDLWSIPSKPFRDVHFAVFPEGLCVRPILAGCPRLVCTRCGKPATKGSAGPVCECGGTTRPGVVLDPFAGAGTVGVVARRLGRDYLLIDANPDYCAIARKRIKAQG